MKHQREMHFGQKTLKTAIAADFACTAEGMTCLLAFSHPDLLHDVVRTAYTISNLNCSKIQGFTVMCSLTGCFTRDGFQGHNVHFKKC